MGNRQRCFGITPHPLHGSRVAPPKTASAPSFLACWVGVKGGCCATSVAVD